MVSREIFNRYVDDFARKMPVNAILKGLNQEDIAIIENMLDMKDPRSELADGAVQSAFKLLNDLGDQPELQSEVRKIIIAECKKSILNKDQSFLDYASSIAIHDILDILNQESKDSLLEMIRKSPGFHDQIAKNQPFNVKDALKILGEDHPQISSEIRKILMDSVAAEDEPDMPSAKRGRHMDSVAAEDKLDMPSAKRGHHMDPVAAEDELDMPSAKRGHHMDSVAAEDEPDMPSVQRGNHPFVSVDAFSKFGLSKMLEKHKSEIQFSEKEGIILGDIEKVKEDLDPIINKLRQNPCPVKVEGNKTSHMHNGNVIITEERSQDGKVKFTANTKAMKSGCIVTVPHLKEENGQKVATGGYDILEFGADGKLINCNRIGDVKNSTLDPAWLAKEMEHVVHLRKLNLSPQIAEQIRDAAKPLTENAKQHDAQNHANFPAPNKNQGLSRT